MSKELNGMRDVLSFFNWFFGRHPKGDQTPHLPWELPRGAVHVWKYCRADKHTGRDIFCPECNAPSTVFHFGWSALQCGNCGDMTDKYDWFAVRTEEEVKRSKGKKDK